MDLSRFELPQPVYVTVDGIQIATYELVAGSRDTAAEVVFCHGTPWSARIWADVATQLGDGYRVLLWDMPGYGRSAKGPEVRTDLVSQLSRLTGLLDHWQLESPHVVAHDIGGAVALGAHLLNGSDYASLFLWDVVTLEPWGSPFFRLVAEHPEVFAALPAALHMAVVREYISGAARNPLGDEMIAALSTPWQGELGQRAFYQQISELRVEDTEPVAERLSQVRCATAIGWGEHDRWIPLEHAARLQRLLPGKPHLTTVFDVGHLVPVEASERVWCALGDWITSIDIQHNGKPDAGEGAARGRPATPGRTSKGQTKRC
ncbi:alpha/beta hydrolase [Rhodococcus sp. H29-C3]|uniref:alpha/beta fold hydrolase n=1 Tax=Rhodococcus sp. H29-C3 TaxID=3046307 RepID=UPI0024B8A89F|nr:alpha/beta hydrolase [Rhodococcus sp. H29-C3]MDJ0363207.1 alpha/beta hydrolase [Rhodococcus sp. H29-C3]